MKILILLIVCLLLLLAIWLYMKKGKNISKILLGITSAPSFPLNNINFQFVTPYFNNRKVLLSANYDITDSSALHTIFSGWGGSLLTTYNNVTITPGVNRCNDNLDCYPTPVGQYSFETYINDVYITNIGNSDSWDISYNVLSLLKYITNIQDNTINSSNFPYKIQRIEISFALNSDGTKKLSNTYSVFKFNVIIPDCIQNFWNQTQCINNKITYDRTLFSGNYCPNIIQTKTENCVPPDPSDCNTNGCYIGYIKENFKYIGCVRYPDVPVNSVWINQTPYTYTKNGSTINTNLLDYINGNNETNQAIPINKAIPLIKSKYPNYKYIFATFAEGDTTFIYYLVSNTLETDTVKLETNNTACSVLNSGIHAGYYIGCKPDNLDIICSNKKIPSNVVWSVYDTTLFNCRTCEYGKDINYQNNSCDFTCSGDNYYYDGVGCTYNNDITKKVNSTKTGVEDRCINNSYYDLYSNSCIKCSNVEQVNSTKNGCIPICTPTDTNYYNINSKLCVSCRNNQNTQYTLTEQKSFSDYRNACIGKCNSLQNLTFNFVSPSDIVLLTKKYNISDNNIRLNFIFSGSGGSLLRDNNCYISAGGFGCCSNDSADLNNCISEPKSRYKFEVYINDKYIMDYSSAGYWDVNYNPLNILLSAFDLDPNVYNYTNFPYSIDKINISYALNSNNNPKTFIVEYDGSIENIFKFNIITSSGSNFYSTNNICQQCSPGTRTDQNGSCIQACSNDKYLNQTTYRCELCNNWQIPNSTQTGCINKCTEPSKIWNNTTSQCETCPIQSGIYTYADQTNNICVTPCPNTNTYYDLSSKTCKACPYWQKPNSSQTGCTNKCTGTQPYNRSTGLCDGTCVTSTGGSIYDSVSGLCKSTQRYCQDNGCASDPTKRCYYFRTGYICGVCQPGYYRDTLNPAATCVLNF